MKPRSTPSDDDALFRARLDQILDPTHPLIRLAEKIDWDQVDERVALCYADEGRPGLSPRLMVGLHYLKHAFDESDESVCERWVENPYWQYFCGEAYLQHELPIDPSSMTRWRDRVGEKLFSDLLGLTIHLAVTLNLVKPKQLTEVAVDTTVQPKAIAHPTDARLYDKARRKLIEAARQEGVPLRQSYARKGPEALRKHGRYAHARQFKRARRERKRLRNYLGRLLREFERHARQSNFRGFDENTEQLLVLCARLYRQQTKDKNKLYALHAPEVVCIAKGKAKTPYEFGSKVSVTTTLTGGWALDCTSLYGNPYDGHTLSMRLLATELRTGRKVTLASVDQGYRGHETDELLGVTVLMPKDKKRPPEEEIEPSPSEDAHASKRDRADDRPPQARPSHGTVLPQGRARRSDQRTGRRDGPEPAETTGGDQAAWPLRSVGRCALARRAVRRSRQVTAISIGVRMMRFIRDD